MSDNLVDQIRSGAFGFAEDLGAEVIKEEAVVQDDLFFDQEIVAEVASVQLLTFFVGQQIYALPLEFVETVLNVGNLTSYPSTHPDLLGGFQHRNDVLPLMDLHAMLQEDGEAQKRKIVLLRVEGRRIGFAIDALRRAQKVPYGQLAPLEDDVSPMVRNYFDAVATIEDEAILVISPAALYSRQATAYGDAE